MKHIIFTILVLVTMFLFFSCINEDVSILETEINSIASESSAITAEIECSSNDDISDENHFIATGIYNGNTVTMEYSTITNYKVDSSHLGPVAFGYSCAVLDLDDDYGFGLVNTEGNILNNKLYSFSRGFSADGLAEVLFQDGSWHYIDANGKDMGLVEAYSNSDGSLSVDNWFYGEKGSYGLIDDNGTKVTEPIFDSYDSASKGYARVWYFKNGNLTDGYVDRKGNIIELPESARIANMVGDRIYLKSQTDSMWTVLDLNGNAVLPKKYQDLEICNNKYYAVIDNGKLGLLDFDGNEIITPTLSCDWSEDTNISYGEGYLTVSKDGYLAFVKITGV